MSRYCWIGLSGWLFLVIAAVGCGDDDDETPVDGGSGGSSAPAGKALESLTAAETEALCDDLLDVVRAASTPERQCIEAALSSDATSEAECNRARMECLDDEAYDDFDAFRCTEFTGSGASTAPEFECDTKVSEVKACYSSVSSWLRGLRCSQAGDAPETPACVEELESECDFGLSALIEVPEANACEQSGSSACSCGGETYDYDFGVGAQCNSCATQNCCDSFAECQNDTACKCFWECLGQGETSANCYPRCNITTFPPAFSDHAACLTTSCRETCEL